MWQLLIIFYFASGSLGYFMDIFLVAVYLILKDFSILLYTYCSLFLGFGVFLRMQHFFHKHFDNFIFFFFMQVSNFQLLAYILK